MSYKILQNLHFEQEMGEDYFIQKMQFLFHIIFAKTSIIFLIFFFLFIIFITIMQLSNNLNLLF